MSEHKIQSSSDILTLNLYPVKKEMYKIKSEWNPKTFLVSFKLETNEEILIEKSLKAITKGNSDYVIANILQTRYDRVLIISNEEKLEITKSSSKFIEENIVSKIIELHNNYITHINK
jgi:phosphopantothenate-cysteine ligase